MRPPRSLPLLLLGALVALATGVPAQEVPDFSGIWLRDETQSDDVEQRLEEVFARSGQGARLGGQSPFGNFGSGRRGGRTRQGPPGGAQGPGAASGGARERTLHLAQGLQVLQIEQGAQQLSVKNAHRETRIFYLDGRRMGDGFGSSSSATVQGRQLVLETQADRAQLVETYEIAGDGSQMVLTVDIQGGRGALGDFQFRTVFERIGEVEPASVGPTSTDPPEPAEAKAAPVARARVVAAEPRETPPESATASDAPARAPRATVQEILDRDTPFSATSAIRVLPPARVGTELLRGKTRIQTLVIDPLVERVEFYLDEELVAKKTLPPFEATVPMADPPREQILRVAAYGPSGRHLGDDVRTLNRIDPPFRVRLTGFEGDPTSGRFDALADVSVPRDADLEAVTFYLGEDEVARVSEAPYRAAIDAPDVSPQSYVRVVARLGDGRELEDVELLLAADFEEEVQVHLVQLQVLVTDKRGTPLTGLEPADFEVTHAGSTRPLQRLYLSKDVPLTLGLSIDSSGSMAPIWPATRRAAQTFLDRTLQPRDQAFVVDFDSQLRLLQPVTADKRRLFSSLGRLVPRGGTALYDSVLFSMLQYDEHAGRRALIVLTDGFDSESKADPKRAIQFGQQLGVPVYVIAMDSQRGPRGGFGGQVALAAGAMKGQMKLITEPTGGRMFSTRSGEQVVRAFEQIQDELRNQYVLTFYTDRAPEPGDDLRVRVRTKGAKVKTALPLDLAN